MNFSWPSDWIGSSGILGAVLSLATLAVTWVRDHDAAARFTRELTNATTRVTFWKTWVEAQVAVGLSGDDLEHAKSLGYEELNHLAQTMQALTVNRDETRVDVRDKEPWSISRAFLLYFPPRSSIGIWLLRAYFYFCVLVGPPELILVSSEQVRNRGSFGISEGLASAVFLVVWVIVLRSLIIYLEERRPQPRNVVTS